MSNHTDQRGVPVPGAYARWKVRRAIDKLGYTYRELQDIFGVSAATLHRLYHGTNAHGPTKRTCDRIIFSSIPYQPTLPGFEDVELAD